MMNMNNYCFGIWNDLFECVQSVLVRNYVCSFYRPEKWNISKECCKFSQKLNENDIQSNFNMKK